jgi:hypothetical protein
MQSASTIPSTEINVNDKNVNAEYLRPNSATPFESLKPTLIIEYSPSMSRPVKKVMLISTGIPSDTSQIGVVVGPPVKIRKYLKIC